MFGLEDLKEKRIQKLEQEVKELKEKLEKQQNESVGSPSPELLQEGVNARYPSDGIYRKDEENFDN